MPPEPQEPVYLDEDHQRIMEFAEDFMDDDERDVFVETLMERRGYTRIQGWGPPDPGRQQPEPDPEPPQRGGRARAPQQPRQRKGAYFKR